MLCYKPLIKIHESQTSLIKEYGQQFISYKWFKEKSLNRLLASGAIQMLKCGQCINCINMKRFHWVKKMCLEKPYWTNTYFITLTYNDENYPDQLVVKHIQNFIKALRYRLNESFRYFCSGEYGSKTARAHYHMILFTNYDLDLEFRKQTKTGPLFECKLLNDCWKKGFIWVAHDLDFMSFAYVSSYSNKNYLKTHQNQIRKEFNKKVNVILDNNNLSGFLKYVEIDKLIPMILFKKNEFIVMSKKPPIGSSEKVNYKHLPSSLLKWFNSKIEYNENDLSVLLNNPYFTELKKRQEEFSNFLKFNNISDIINYERLDNLQKDSKVKKGIL